MTLTGFINRTVFWLRERPVINVILIVVYFLLILFMHQPLAALSERTEKQISLDLYNRLVEIVYVIFLVILIGVISMLARKHKDNLQLKLRYLSLTVLFIFIHSRFMFDSKIEVIHSFEFTFLAFLIFPRFERFGAAVFFALPFMLIDEWYQYIVLYPYLDYMDLNDIMMDTYGCGLAMTVLMFTGVKGENPVKPLLNRVEFISLIAAVLLVLFLVKICIIAPYATDKCSNTLLLINEGPGPEPFWRPHPTHHIMYHVMKPLEALIAITVLHLFYFGLDGFTKTKAVSR